MGFKNITDSDLDVNDLIKVDDKYIIAKKSHGDSCKDCIFYSGKHIRFNLPNLCNTNRIYCQSNRRRLHPDSDYSLIFDIFSGI